MNTGSRDEQELLRNVGRIARALERIANALERRSPMPPKPSRGEMTAAWRALIRNEAEAQAMDEADPSAVDPDEARE